jgi:hypothetical protein
MSQSVERPAERRGPAGVERARVARRATRSQFEGLALPQPALLMPGTWALMCQPRRGTAMLLRVRRNRPKADPPSTQASAGGGADLAGRGDYAGVQRAVRRYLQGSVALSLQKQRCTE